MRCHSHKRGAQSAQTAIMAIVETVLCLSSGPFQTTKKILTLKRNPAEFFYFMPFPHVQESLNIKAIEAEVNYLDFENFEFSHDCKNREDCKLYRFSSGTSRFKVLGS